MQAQSSEASLLPQEAALAALRARLQIQFDPDNPQHEVRSWTLLLCIPDIWPLGDGVTRPAWKLCLRKTLVLGLLAASTILSMSSFLEYSAFTATVHCRQNRITGKKGSTQSCHVIVWDVAEATTPFLLAPALEGPARVNCKPLEAFVRS